MILPRSLSQPCTPSTLNAIFRSSLTEQSGGMEGHGSVEATIYLTVSANIRPDCLRAQGLYKHFPTSPLIACNYIQK